MAPEKSHFVFLRIRQHGRGEQSASRPSVQLVSSLTDSLNRSGAILSENAPIQTRDLFNEIVNRDTRASCWYPVMLSSPANLLNLELRSAYLNCRCGRGVRYNRQSPPKAVLPEPARLLRSGGRAAGPAVRDPVKRDWCSSGAENRQSTIPKLPSPSNFPNLQLRSARSDS